MAGPENKFRDKVVRPWLDAREDVYYFVKEALVIRGIPDIVGCINGKYFTLELKKDRSSCRKRTGRIVLQRRGIEKVKAVGGFGEIVSPHNWEDTQKDLLEFAYC